MTGNTTLDKMNLLSLTYGVNLLYSTTICRSLHLIFRNHLTKYGTQFRINFYLARSQLCISIENWPGYHCRSWCPQLQFPFCQCHNSARLNTNSYTVPSQHRSNSFSLQIIFIVTPISLPSIIVSGIHVDRK